MKENISNNYFVVLRIIILFAFSIFGVLNISEAGASLGILLLNMFFISSMFIKEILKGKWKIPAYIVSVLLYIVLVVIGGREFLLLGFFLVFEILTALSVGYRWYLIVSLVSLAPSPYGTDVQIMIVFLLAICYIQHYFIVLEYKKQMMEDTIVEQDLKRDMYRKEAENKAETRKNMLLAENRLLEQRSRLAQTLHDKLGHNINGSIYQLEAIKVLMEKDPEKSKAMLQAVIDQMRSGMDEIRAILRKERPEKKEQSMLQLYKLCEECNNKGVETKLEAKGDISLIPESLWNIILDNAFEAVTNSMRYSKCTRIDINILLMNKMVRCSISDNGVGCSHLVDGMGISGMRDRVRNAGGTISFETDLGFKVNMLMPL
ncbi:MAG: hypothetical protein IKP88_08910 [Lachnospiraceae bacterium]|nr:hypothetical protein [Lachnospiraceae bacterium]